MSVPTPFPGDVHSKQMCPYNKHQCDGVLTYGPDPFQQEIYNDDSSYWMCEGQRYESAMDI